MELEFFYIKKIIVSQPSQLKLKRVANHYLKRSFFLFLQYSIKILNEKNPTQILLRNSKFLTNITTMLITTYETIHLALHVERFKI